MTYSLPHAYAVHYTTYTFVCKPASVCLQRFSSIFETSIRGQHFIVSFYYRYNNYNCDLFSSIKDFFLRGIFILYISKKQA